MVRTVQRLNGLQEIGLPPFDRHAVGQFVDVERFRIVARVVAAVPNIALAESPDDAIGRLVDTDRQIAVAQQQPVLDGHDRSIDRDDVRVVVGALHA